MNTVLVSFVVFEQNAKKTDLALLARHLAILPNI